MATHFATHRPLLMSTDWMITADHPLAVHAGAAVLESGGNAVDAAVAANLVLGVVKPHMCGIGGDLFMLIHVAGGGTTEGLNASGRAPAGASLDAYADLGHARIPAIGIHSCTVPGAIAGWQAALDRYGTMGLDALLARAIPYAQNGFPVYPDLVAALDERQAPLLAAGAAGDTFLAGGVVPRVGQLMVQPQLARSYRLLMENGPDAFYRGPLGEAFIDHSQALGGWFSEADLCGHTVTWATPIQSDYRGYRLATMPPNSQGIAWLMQANMLAAHDLTAMAVDSAELIHRMVEAKKLAFGYRDAYVCDPRVHPVPLDLMLSPTLAMDCVNRIDPDRAATGFAPRGLAAGGDDTVCLTVVDADGNGVVLIQSIYEAFGSCVMVPATGMLLHNRACGFTLDPAHPNVLAPGKRPYHTLHPAMILKGGRPVVLLGTPGADGQTQTNIQVAMDLIDFAADPQQAVEAPRWRSNPDGSLTMENRFPATTIGALEAKGHRVQVVDGYAAVMGSAQVIMRDGANGVLKAGADPRRQAYAIGK